MNNTSIGWNDVVSIKDKFLIKADGTRFMIRGIAFPISAEPGIADVDGWIRVLRQLNSLTLMYNTVRVYTMDPSIDYSPFFNEAASMGIYVMVPLTAAKGDGVLRRDIAAPACYTEQLFQYGVASLTNYLRYPNVIAGFIGNEVVNSLESWHAAPCLKAYTRDLKNYMKETMGRSLPIVYAAQHDSYSAAVTPSKSMRLISDYLTCVVEEPDPKGESIIGNNVTSISESIDIFGVNIESWCSSKNTFRYDEQGTDGSLYVLWNDMHGSNVPLVFTEIGCPHYLYNRDNGLKTPDGTRDWLEVPVVLHDMNDTWSGLIAYAYDGNPMFRMFGKENWNGNDTLPPLEDFYNFRNQLALPQQDTKSSGDNREKLGLVFTNPPRRCRDVELEVHDLFDINLVSVSDNPSFYWHSQYQQHRTRESVSGTFSAKFMPFLYVVVVCSAIFYAFYATQKKQRKASSKEQKIIMSEIVSYHAIDSNGS
jgi:hypothetical protein